MTFTQRWAMWVLAEWSAEQALRWFICMCVEWRQSEERMTSHLFLGQIFLGT